MIENRPAASLRSQRRHRDDEVNGAPEEIRTPDPQIRSKQNQYALEGQAQPFKANLLFPLVVFSNYGALRGHKTPVVRSALGPQMPRFTDRLLSSLALETGQKDRLFFDTDCPQLAVRLSHNGKRHFVAQWTDRGTGKKHREPLGRWGSITILQARDACRQILGEVARGGNPTLERINKREAEAAQAADAAFSLEKLITEWALRHLSKRRPRYAAEAQRALRVSFAKHLGSPASKIDKKTIFSVLDKIEATGRESAARHALTYGRAAYGWALKRELVQTNPFVGLPEIGRSRTRERTLDEAELILVWRAARAVPYPYGPFFTLALLTLQRRNEVAGARWSEFDTMFSVWRIPGSRMKNGQAHDVPLPDLARQVLIELRESKLGNCDLVFENGRKTQISGFSKAKKELDTQIDRLAIAGIVASFCIHDFRRSGASWLAREGFDTIAIDKILDHQPVKLRGIAGVYQKYDYYEVRKKALQAWGSLFTNANIDPVKI